MFKSKDESKSPDFNKYVNFENDIALFERKLSKKIEKLAIGESLKIILNNESITLKRTKENKVEIV